MSLSEQTAAVKTAIQNAFLAVGIRIDNEISAVESRLLDYADDISSEKINEVVRYNPVIVESSDEVEYQKGQEESFSDVFNTWKRISHNNTNTYPADISEISAWSYDATADQIRCTINSATLVGFISPTKFEDYNFEVLVNSTQTDDDQIGICLAFTELGGREYTLTALRNPQGNGINATARFQIVYNYRQSDEKVVFETSSGLTTGTGWSTMSTGIRIRAERSGDTFIIKTTDNDGSTFVTAAEASIDLTTDPDLAKFRGAKRYGYVAFSQSDSSWSTLARPIKLNEIIDVAAMVRWNYDGNSWVSSQIGASESIAEARRFFYNESTSRFYVSDDVGDVHGIVLSEYLTAALANKVDKVAGKGLSTNDFTNDEKTKLANAVTSTDVTGIVKVTESTYPANPDPNVLYIVVAG